MNDQDVTDLSTEIDNHHPQGCPNYRPRLDTDPPAGWSHGACTLAHECTVTSCMWNPHR